MMPGFVVDVDVPAVKHAPPKKYQLLVVLVPVKSSLKVTWARLAPAASVPSRMPRATQRCLAFIILASFIS